MPGSNRRRGAPVGNLNHLVHGERSKLVRRAIANALQDPEGRDIVVNLVKRYGVSQGTRGRSGKESKASTLKTKKLRTD